MTTKRIVMTTGSRIRTRLVTSLWALLSVLVIVVAPGPASAATFTVTSTADDSGCNLKPIYASLGFGSCTLRGAIEAVNAQPKGTGPHRINFSIGSGDQTIVLSNALPAIQRPVVIDGGTQPVVLWSNTGLTIGRTTTTCAAVNVNRHPCIQVNAHGLYKPSTPVLTLAGGYSTVRYLAIYNYGGIGTNDDGTGILVTSDNNLIEYNYIGTDVRGVPGLSTTSTTCPTCAQQQGVAVHSPQGSAANTVIRNNVISGNRQNGVLLSGLSVHNSQVVSNFIGTTADGTLAALPPDGDHFTCDNSQPQWGVSVKGGANNNWIQNNLISGNCNGVAIDATDFPDPISPQTGFRTWNQVLGNLIGTDLNGTSCLPNVVPSQLRYGVRISNASSNSVGGTPGTVNVISCYFYGMTIEGTRTDQVARYNKVQGNDIGTNAGAGAKLGNNTGVLLSGQVTGTEISGNVVANNGKDGINVNSVSTDPQFNFVQNNTVSDNGVNGIVMQSGAIGNTVQSNTALGNHPDLTEYNSNTSPCPNTWLSNTFVTTGGVGQSCIH